MSSSYRDGFIFSFEVGGLLFHSFAQVPWLGPSGHLLLPRKRVHLGPHALCPRSSGLPQASPRVPGELQLFTPLWPLISYFSCPHPIPLHLFLVAPHRILVPQPGIEPTRPHRDHGVLTTGPWEGKKSLFFLNFRECTSSVLTCYDVNILKVSRISQAWVILG